MKKHCNVCDKDYDPDFPDPCLGKLPGVRFACCGHGEGGAYISFENGLAIYFEPQYIINYENLPDDAHDENGFVRRSRSVTVDFEKKRS